MKKQLFFLLMLALLSGSMYAQSTIILAKWTFPADDSLSVLPDTCISQNATKYISAEDTTAYPATITRDIFFTNGVTSFAATAVGWNNGTMAKLWSIKFKSNSASNLTISSSQRSGGNYPGPKNWKIQARISGQPWVDVPGGNITLTTSTWVSVANLPLGSTFDNQTSSMFVRWIVISDTSTAGTIVDSSGISKIDDVVIKGTSITGVQEIFYNSVFNYYPNPTNANILNIESSKGIKVLDIYNFQGQLVHSFNEIGYYKTISIDMLKPGVYFLRPQYNDNSASTPSKLIVE